MRRILVVDDDPDVLRTVGWTLEAAGYDAVLCASASQAREWMGRHGLPHLAVLDIVMEGTDGLELAAEIAAACDLPIIFLTSVAERETVVGALERLAEDYVLKPFHPDELAARVGRVLRRVSDFGYAEGRRLVLGHGIEIDFVRQVVWVQGEEVRLTATESKLLFVLSTASPRTVTAAHLLSRLWPDGTVFEDALRVHVHRVRHKIEAAPSKPRLLQTVRGIGYRLGPGE